MATAFSTLPIVDLAPLSAAPGGSAAELARLSAELDAVFRTTGFAYLVNAPLSFSHERVFALAREFFELSREEKMRVAKRSFREGNANTYRGYFPPQAGASDNLKEGFEIGPSTAHSDLSSCVPTKHTTNPASVDLNEPNVWPPTTAFPSTSRTALERLHAELQHLSTTLLGLLQQALVDDNINNHQQFLSDAGSLSTLRLLHYPPSSNNNDNDEEELCCTPHTDSGILTLLHQDRTGGLEVRDARGEWVAAPWVAGSVVVNIGDLMARVSGGRYVATVHRVRRRRGEGEGRLSVPFFFEPGEGCVVAGGEDEDGVRYGEHVRAKMRGWVEFGGPGGEGGELEERRGIVAVS